MDIKLPSKFSDLTPFCDWALPSPDQRQSKRRSSSRGQLQAFYDAIVPHMEAILAEVDSYPMGEIPETHQGLFNMALSLAEVAPHIELYGGSPGVPHAFDESRFIAVHGAQETWRGARPSAAS